MELINKKYKNLCKEILWRFGNTDYSHEDKANVVIHETIDKEVSFISIAEIESLADELGVVKILEIEQDYLNEYGEIAEDKKGVDKLRVILYYYFEQKVFNDNKMTEKLKL